MHDLLLLAHILGACILIGTGTGIAFFMLMAQLDRDPAFIAKTAGVVVIADTIFTATAAIAQPVTGYFLARALGWPLLDGWHLAALLLYALIGLCWLPVVWIQIRMRDLARTAVQTGTPLPPAYHRLARIWITLGIPAFAAILAVLWLMITKPAL